MPDEAIDPTRSCVICGGFHNPTVPLMRDLRERLEEIGEGVCCLRCRRDADRLFRDGRLMNREEIEARAAAVRRESGDKMRFPEPAADEPRPAPVIEKPPTRKEKRPVLATTNGHVSNGRAETTVPDFVAMRAGAGPRELEQIVARIMACEAEIESLRVFEKALRKKCAPPRTAGVTGGGAEKLGDVIAQYVREHGPSDADAIARHAGRDLGVVLATAKRTNRFAVANDRISLKRAGAK